MPRRECGPPAAGSDSTLGSAFNSNGRSNADAPGTKELPMVEAEALLQARVAPATIPCVRGAPLATEQQQQQQQEEKEQEHEKEQEPTVQTRSPS